MLVFGCVWVFGVWIAACACNFVCVMCVFVGCAWGWRDASRAEVVDAEQDVLMCV